MGDDLMSNGFVADAILCQMVFIEKMAERTVSYVVQECTDPQYFLYVGEGGA